MYWYALDSVTFGVLSVSYMNIICWFALDTLIGWCAILSSFCNFVGIRYVHKQCTLSLNVSFGNIKCLFAFLTFIGWCAIVHSLYSLLYCVLVLILICIRHSYWRYANWCAFFIWECYMGNIPNQRKHPHQLMITPVGSHQEPCIHGRICNSGYKNHKITSWCRFFLWLGKLLHILIWCAYYFKWECEMLFSSLHSNWMVCHLVFFIALYTVIGYLQFYVLFAISGNMKYCKLSLVGMPFDVLICIRQSAIWCALCFIYESYMLTCIGHSC